MATNTRRVVFFFLAVIMAVQSSGFDKKLNKVATEVEKWMKNLPAKAYYELVASALDGANLGLKQCRQQFQFSKWNCNIRLPKEQMGKLPLFLTTSIPHGTREEAFVYSIIAAGVTYALARDCRLKKFDYCVRMNRLMYKSQNIALRNHTGSIYFGEVMAKHFLEMLEEGRTERKQLISHNNEVGRKMVTRMVIVTCRCHGGTWGNCVLKTCWFEPVELEEIGKHLKKKYKNAKQVCYTKNHPKENVQKEYKPVAQKDPATLFFTESSPDYCQRNLTIGATGVLGRVCEGSKKDLEQCRIMCNSCGFKAVDFKEVGKVKCNYDRDEARTTQFKSRRSLSFVKHDLTPNSKQQGLPQPKVRKTSEGDTHTNLRQLLEDVCIEEEDSTVEQEELVNVLGIGDDMSAKSRLSRAVSKFS